MHFISPLIQFCVCVLNTLSSFSNLKGGLYQDFYVFSPLICSPFRSASPFFFAVVPIFAPGQLRKMNDSVKWQAGRELERDA